MEGKVLALAVVAAGLAAIGLGTLMLYSGEPPPAPPLPQAPPPPEVTMNTELKYSQPVWRALIETDARRLKVPVPTIEEMSQPNPYFEELTGSRILRKGAALETAHLRLTVETSREKASLEGQSYSVDHLVLHIKNRTPKFLAYRVETKVVDKRKCSSKGNLPHNAFVIPPDETIRRTECLYRKNEAIEVTHIEVIELPGLQAFYVSRLQPSPVLLDPRTFAGHVPLEGAGTLCAQSFSWREIQDGVDRGDIGWRDVVDFYARHSCDEYSFFPRYHYRSDPAGPLPVRPY